MPITFEITLEDDIVEAVEKVLATQQVPRQITAIVDGREVGLTVLEPAIPGGVAGWIDILVTQNVAQFAHDLPRVKAAKDAVEAAQKAVTDACRVVKVERKK